MVNVSPVPIFQAKFGAKPKEKRRSIIETKGGENMIRMEIYFKDLHEEAKKRFIETFGLPEDSNLDEFPLAVVEIEDSEEEGK